MITTMRVFLSNLAWFVSTLPDAIRFWRALGNPARAQRTAAARRKATRPEDVILYEPTSGTTGGTKWIPYTEQLRREFMRAVNPWMASVYLRHPGLLFCTHYWSISPYTEVKSPKDGPRRGFAEDRDYLGSFRSRLTRVLFPVTASVAGERDPERHRWLTAKALVASRRLGLVSVWHPSAFLKLLDYMSAHAAEFASGEVASALSARDYRRVWPRLRFISCWDAAFAAADAARLRAFFPGVKVEGKGVMATEGVVTFPWFGRTVAAVTSHTLGFERVDAATGEPVEGTAVGVERIKVGERYGIVLTTGNGFTDYRLGDVMECTGFVRRTPVLKFCHRSGGVVDLHGEKMHPGFVSEVIAALAVDCGMPKFAMMCPTESGNGYRLQWEPTASGRLPSVTEVEALLCGNYHYGHARNLGQLAQVRVERIEDGLSRWCAERGMMESSAKVPCLQTPKML